MKRAPLLVVSIVGLAPALAQTSGGASERARRITNKKARTFRCGSDKAKQ
jgi:hypothetical protein